MMKEIQIQIRIVTFFPRSMTFEPDFRLRDDRVFEDPTSDCPAMITSTVEHVTDFGDNPI